MRVIKPPPLSAFRVLEGEEPRDSLRAIRSMVSEDDLSVVFQPIVDLATGRLFASEALVRCRIAQFQPPPKLFEHAQQLGCVGRLGRLIREIAIPLCSGAPIFVNVHPGELDQGWLVRPDDPIFSHDADVYLEITESVPMSHFSLCVSVLREVCSRGQVYLVIDDLGAGYSNLKRIADLQPNMVKIDGSLVRGLDANNRQQILVKRVVRLCTDLMASVVAEGIESASELQAVRDAGVQFGQGFLLARPAYPIPALSLPPWG
ncbi:MAG TPA: EAL domain-containing protein [Polyangiaceae bacterium]|nr:EAL domain-containing protein [Polyangiaceae bacterium]